MTLHTTQDWHNTAHSNLNQAVYKQHQAINQIDLSVNCHNETMSDQLSMYSELQTQLSNKVQTSYRLVEKLRKKVESMERGIEATKDSLAKLEKANRDKEAPLHFCSWRMEQRARRPLREQVRDVVEIGLDEEKTTIVNSQRKLTDAMKRTTNVVQRLEATLDELKQDIENKAQALGVDEMCLRNTRRSYMTVADRMSSTGYSQDPMGTRIPAGGKRSSAHQVALNESQNNEMNRQRETMRLAQAATQREEVAAQLRDENAKLVARCQRAVDDAAAKTERLLQERINESQGMRRRLESEIRETRSKIDHTKQTITDTRTQIKHLEEPAELAGTCSSWRKQRSTREQFNDPVTTQLQQHQMTLLRAAEDLREHQVAEKTLLHDLLEHKDRLSEDLKDKTSALHIDLNCLSHEASRCSRSGKPAPSLAKSKLSKASKVDPNFVPLNLGGRVTPLRMVAPLSAR